MKNILFTFCLSFICISVFAQSITWGPAKKVRGKLTMVGERGDDIVLTFNEMKGFMGLGGTKQNLLIYDKFFKEKSKIDILKIIGKDVMLFDIILKDDGYQAIGWNMSKKETKEKTNTINKYEFSEKKLISSDYFFEQPEGLYLSLLNDDRLLERKGSHFIFVYPNDKSKIGILASNNKSHNISFKLFDRKDEFNILTDINIDGIDLKKKNELSDYKVKNDGSILILIKSYLGKSKKEKVKGNPNYYYKLYNIKGNEVVEYKMPRQDVFTEEPIIEIDKEGNIYFLSLYEHKRKKGVEGILFTKFDKQGEIKFSNKLPTKSLEKGKKKLNKYVVLSGVAVLNDMIILKSQHKLLETKTKSNSNTSFSSTTETYIYKDLIFDGISLEGDYLWSNRIIRNDYSHAAEYLKQTTYYNDDGLFVFLNTNYSHLKKLDNDKLGSKKTPSKRNHIVKLTVDKSGKHKYEDVTGTYGVTKFDSMVGDKTGNFYFMGVTPNATKLRVGGLK